MNHFARVCALSRYQVCKLGSVHAWKTVYVVFGTWVVKDSNMVSILSCYVDFGKLCNLATLQFRHLQNEQIIVST